MRKWKRNSLRLDWAGDWGPTRDKLTFEPIKKTKNKKCFVVVNDALSGV
jgi:hypothetical protein